MNVSIPEPKKGWLQSQIKTEKVDEDLDGIIIRAYREREE